MYPIPNRLYTEEEVEAVLQKHIRPLVSTRKMKEIMDDLKRPVPKDTGCLK